MTMSTPMTIAEIFELVSKLKSRKAVYTVAIAHIRAFYKKSDAGPAELVLTGDMGVVPELHIEETIIEMENRIEMIDAELEELQSRPVGGTPAPASDQPSVQTFDHGTKEDDAIAGAARASKAASDKKGAPGGKSRAQGSGPS